MADRLTDAGLQGFLGSLVSAHQVGGVEHCAGLVADPGRNQLGAIGAGDGLAVVVLLLALVELRANDADRLAALTRPPAVSLCLGSTDPKRQGVTPEHGAELQQDWIGAPIGLAGFEVAVVALLASPLPAPWRQVAGFHQCHHIGHQQLLGAGAVVGLAGFAGRLGCGCHFLGEPCQVVEMGQGQARAGDRTRPPASTDLATVAAADQNSPQPTVRRPFRGSRASRRVIGPRSSP